MKELTGFMVDCVLAFTTCNAVNICLIFKNEMTKSKFVCYLFETEKKIENQTEGFCSIVDQTQDLSFGT